MRRTSMPRTRSLAALLSLCILGAMTGCGSAPDSSAAADSSKTGQDLVDAAKKEGALTWYSTIPPEQSDLVSSLFEKEYGIKVSVLHLTGAEMSERFLGEQSAKVRSSDILTISQPTIFEQEKKSFAEVNPDQITSWDGFPEDGKHGYFAITEIQPNVIQYNTDLVPPDKVPSTWEDMLDPFWKGHLLLTDPRTTTTYMGWAAEMESVFGIDYLEKLGQQNPELVASATPGAQQVAAGAAYANIPALEGNASALIKQGAPIAVVVPEEGQVGPPIYTGMVANAPHPNATRLFYDFLLSPETMTAICAENDISTLYPPDQVQGCVPLPESWHLLDFGILDDKEHSDRLVEALGIH